MPIATTQTGTPAVPGVQRVGDIVRFSPSESISIGASTEHGARDRVGAIEIELNVLDRAQASARARRAVAGTATPR